MDRPTISTGARIKLAAVNVVRGTPLFPFLLRRMRPSSAEVELLSQFVRKDSLVFDIGANVGHLTRVFRHLGATVVSLEPQERIFRILQKVYRDDPRVKPINKAMGAKEGEGEITLATESGLSSMSEE